ncbi:MAG: DUF4924 family protein [Bacteroidetes bacterium]|nr:DUF4924 family protein [Bacteroidota bacterium]MDA1242267.1 DUF4924 family protein [Bacteroidota bacterium]
MTVAQVKKEQHIVDYLLFCWQMEDLVRAAKFDVAMLQNWAEQQAEDEGTHPEEEVQWLLGLAADMKTSGAQEQGHCNQVQETMMELAHLHELLVGAMVDSNYQEAFREARPLLDELTKRLDRDMHPVEKLSMGLYGWLVMRMKKTEVSAETESAMVGLRTWANELAKGHLKVYYGRG